MLPAKQSALAARAILIVSSERESESVKKVTIYSVARVMISMLLSLLIISNSKTSKTEEDVRRHINLEACPGEHFVEWTCDRLCTHNKAPHRGRRFQNQPAAG